MKVLFLGSGEFGIPTLAHLRQTHELTLVVSQPDRPAGRGKQLAPTPVSAWALEQGVELLRTADVNELAVMQQLAEYRADVAVVIAFGQKLSADLVQMMGKLSVNLHASLLPKYRGAAPINWAILRGETVTGNSVISLAQRMDAGLVYGQSERPIEPRTTAGELHDLLAADGPRLVTQVLEEFAAGRLRGVVQDETQATKAPKLKKEDGRLRFDQPAEEIRRRVHGLTPWPGVTVLWKRRSGGDPVPLRIHRVEVTVAGSKLDEPGVVIEPGIVLATPADSSAIRLLELQLPGKRVMSFAEFQRGNPMQVGDQLRASE